MQSNDARMLLHCIVPTAAVGVVASVVGGVLAGGKGAVGALLGAVVVILFMGGGMAILQRAAKSFPHLFQAMGLVVYTGQVLVMAIFVIAFNDTTLFNPRAFAAGVGVAVVAWIAAQVVSTSKAKILYVQPETSSEADKPSGTESKV